MEKQGRTRKNKEKQRKNGKKTGRKKTRRGRKKTRKGRNSKEGKKQGEGGGRETRGGEETKKSKEKQRTTKNKKLKQEASKGCLPKRFKKQFFMRNVRRNREAIEARQKEAERKEKERKTRKKKKKKKKKQNSQRIVFPRCFFFPECRFLFCPECLFFLSRLFVFIVPPLGSGGVQVGLGFFFFWILVFYLTFGWTETTRNGTWGSICPCVSLYQCFKTVEKVNAVSWPALPPPSPPRSNVMLSLFM